MKKSVFSLFMLLFLWNISFAIDSTGVTILPSTVTSGVDKITIFEVANQTITCTSKGVTTPVHLVSSAPMTCPPNYTLRGEATPTWIPLTSLRVNAPTYDPSTSTINIYSICQASGTQQVYITLKFFCSLNSGPVPAN